MSAVADAHVQPETQRKPGYKLTPVMQQIPLAALAGVLWWMSRISQKQAPAVINN